MPGLVWLSRVEWVEIHSHCTAKGYFSWVYKWPAYMKSLNGSKNALIAAMYWPNKPWEVKIRKTLVNKDTLWSFLINKQKLCLPSQFLTEMRWVCPWSQTKVLNERYPCFCYWLSLIFNVLYIHVPPQQHCYLRSTTASCWSVGWKPSPWLRRPPHKTSQSATSGHEFHRVTLTLFKHLLIRLATITSIFTLEDKFQG